MNDQAKAKMHLAIACAIAFIVGVVVGYFLRDALLSGVIVV
jgi:Na+/H+-dicarboxylate symporter